MKTHFQYIGIVITPPLKNLPPTPPLPKKCKKTHIKHTSVKFMGRVCLNVEKRHLKMGNYQKKE